MDEDPPPASLETLAKALNVHLANSLRQSARIDALEALLLAVGRKAGFSPEAMAAQLRSVEATIHQARLESLERNSPAAAAIADMRPSGDVQFDEALLESIDFEDPPETDRVE